MNTSQADIDWALAMEKSVTPEEQEFYLDCMNSLPMSWRKSDEQIRAGCILTGVFYRCSGRADKDKS